MSLTRPDRERATAIVVRDGLVLIALDENVDFYFLPGGRIESGETPDEAMVRELDEETGMTLTGAKFLFNHVGPNNYDYVFEVEAEGEPTPHHEIEKVPWWDQRQDLIVHEHTKLILSKYRQLT